MQLEHILQAHGLIGRGGKSTPLPTIINFRGSSNDLGTEIILNWSNPSIIEFQKVQIFMSSTDISNLTYEELVSNGNMIVNEKKTTHTVTGLKHNDTRYFKAFGIFTVLGEEKISNGVNLMVTTKDIIPPATITNFSAKEGNQTVILTWTNPTDNDFSKVKILYKQGSYPNSPTDGMVAYEGSGTTATVTGLTNDVEYYFRAFTYDTSGNINNDTVNQQITAIPSDGDDKSGSPGNINLIAGTMEQGYFGFVPASEFITGDALASLVGISAGTSQFSSEGWLKFAYQGKIQFVAKKPIRHSISWDAINTAGCVFGTKTVEIGGLTYKVRLMRTGLEDPMDEYRGASVHGSEWNKLMLPIHIKAKDGSWAYPYNVEANVPYWGIDFTDEDLLTHNSFGSGSYSWCQETYVSYRVSRGYNGVSDAHLYSPGYKTSYVGWRPVLELVA